MILCRDVYHCTPSELAAQDYKVVALHKAFIEAEQQNDALNNKNKGKKKRKGR